MPDNRPAQPPAQISLFFGYRESERKFSVPVGDADHRHGNEFNEIYSMVFKANWPVRTHVQAAMMDPQCMVELDAIAVVDPASLI
ncbi:RidA family protein [Aquamicrobium defluvii]|nr:RidA family protein [Aquamicrobium defluvii]EZQ13148.1 hypothetical protein CF98_29805 [Halopseudomonas bauzanensis]